MSRPLSKAAMIIAVIISFTAVPAAGIVATAAPALASTHLCQSSGGCLGAPTIGIGYPVELTATGRDLNLEDLGYTCCGGFEVYRFAFTVDTTKCVGVSSINGFNITVRDCSSGNGGGVNWAKLPMGGGEEWWENTYSRSSGLLNSDITLGDQLYVTDELGCCNLYWSG